MWESAERAFQAYGRPLVTFAPFKYMGQILTAADENWPELVGNLRKAKKIWARMERMLGQEGARPRVSGMFFKAVVQAVLLLRSEMWVMTPPYGQGLGEFLSQSRQTYYEETAKEMSGLDLVLPNTGYSNGGGRV